jgi:hypothetical protein
MVRGVNTFLKSNSSPDAASCCEALGGFVNGDFCEGAVINGQVGDFDLQDSCAYMNMLPEAVVEANSGSNGGQNGAQTASTIADIFSGFNFGAFNEAYCELYSLFNKGERPPECKPKSSYNSDNSNSSDEGGGAGKFIVIGLIVVLFAIGGYFLLRKK